MCLYYGYGLVFGRTGGMWVVRRKGRGDCPVSLTGRPGEHDHQFTDDFIPFLYIGIYIKSSFYNTPLETTVYNPW